jgi:hypothetical protein
MRARPERQTIQAEVEPMVQRLFAELGDAGKVVERVKADILLTARARQIALQVALRMSLDRINVAARQPNPWRAAEQEQKRIFSFPPSCCMAR